MNRLLFEKTSSAVYLSHLDTVRAFQRAFRRAGLLLHHSQGYTPHAYISILLPLPVGMASQCEILDYELDEEAAAPQQQLPDLLNRTLPDGLRVLQAYQSPRKAKELAYLRAALALEYDRGVPAGAEAALQSLLAQPELFAPKRTKSGEIVQQNVAQMLHESSLCPAEDGLTLNCVVRAQNPGMNPMQLEKAIRQNLPECAPDFAVCRRLEFLDAEFRVFR